MPMRKNILIGLAVVTISALAFLSQKDKTVSNVEWDCSGGWCNVRMTIKNDNNYKVQSKIVIRAHNQEKYDREPGAKGNKVVGEKYLNVLLEANEQKEIIEQFQLNYPARVHMLVAKRIGTERI